MRAYQKGISYGSDEDKVDITIKIDKINEFVLLVMAIDDAIQDYARKSLRFKDDPEGNAYYEERKEVLSKMYNSLMNRMPDDE